MIKRVCRSTFNAETQAMVDGVAFGQRLRTIIADLKVEIQEGGQWLEQSRDKAKHLWLTDCESLHSYLANPTAASAEDKRLEIDLEDLRQSLWEDADGNPKDTMEEEQTDKVRWIDTSTMLADPLTKLMKAERLEQALSTGVIDLEPTAESQMKKFMKQQQRSKSSKKSVPPEEELADPDEA